MSTTPPAPAPGTPTPSRYHRATASWLALPVYAQRLICVLAIVVIVLLGFYPFSPKAKSYSNGPYYTPTATATVTQTVAPSPTPTATATPTHTAPASPTHIAPATSTSAAYPPSASASASSPASSDCVPVVAHSYSIIGTLRHPPGATSSTKELRTLRGSRYTTMLEFGQFDDASMVNSWLTHATCNGFSGMVELDSTFAAIPSVSHIEPYISAINGHSGLVGYAVSIHAVPGNMGQPINVNAVNHRIAVIRAVSHKQVAVLIDYNSFKDPSYALMLARMYHGDILLPVYLPWKINPDWPVSAYQQVGLQARELNGSKATAAVQAFNWGTQGAQYGFTAVGKPLPTDVGYFTSLLVRGGQLRHVFVYSEEKESDDATYLSGCAAAVARALGV